MHWDVIHSFSSLDKWCVDLIILQLILKCLAYICISAYMVWSRPPPQHLNDVCLVQNYKVIEWSSKSPSSSSHTLIAAINMFACRPLHKWWKRSKPFWTYRISWKFHKPKWLSNISRTSRVEVKLDFYFFLEKWLDLFLLHKLLMIKRICNLKQEYIKTCGVSGSV